ncbi:MAG: S8 family serine peptidase [Roseimicrobium sp.]
MGESHAVVERGVRQLFEVARDEVALPDATGRLQVQRQATVASAEVMRRSAAAQQGELVLYEQGLPRSAWTRRIVRRQVVAKLAAATDGPALAAATGLRFLGEHATAKGYLVFEAEDSGAALLAAEALRARPGVAFAETQLARQQNKRLVPNDPLFAQQWHLQNTGQGAGLAGTDVNLVSVWDSFKGSGIRIGIVDDGLQTAHADLAANVDTTNDFDWNDATPNDPNPDLTADFHGTSCAGVAAARGNNSVGVSGAAPEATLVGLRLIGAASTDSQEAEAMGYKNDIIHVKSNSWGPSDDARRLEGPGTLTKAALQAAATSGRGGKGTIILWAGGNGGDVGDNSNYDGYANSIYTIAVGALGNNGVQAYYSEPGANLVITAPSSGGTRGIVTTDLTGTYGYNTGSVSGELSDNNYTSDFGGTSSATPLAAGCVALLLQANPNLGWRDVQEILIRSATKVHAADGDWSTNGAGFHFNHKYGAGLLNTGAAVALASSWTNLLAQTNATSAQTGLSVAIPVNNVTGVTRTFDLTATNVRVEQVTLTLSATHASRGHLAVTLTSPMGTVSRLAEKHADTGDNYSAWTFSTVRCWGENSQGTWTLNVSDVTSGTAGTLTGATLVVYGTPAGPVNQPPSITAATLSQSGMVFTDQTLTVSSVSASDPEGDTVALAYQWQQTANNTTFTDIAGATAAGLVLSEALSSKLVRCRITPTAAGKTGAAFVTDTAAVNHRPARWGRVGVSYSHDSDLFLASSATTFGRDVIINEFSQGALSGANREWVELLVLRTVDLRGCTLADRSGTYTTFSNVSLWSAVAPGTLIVIFKATERDDLLPTTDDLNAADGTLVIAHTNASAFTGGTWGGLSNSNAESLILRNASAQILDALSLNNENVYDPKLAAVGSTKNAFYTGDTETGVEDKLLWTIGNASAATPGAGNGGVNTTFVSNLRSGTFNVQPQFRLGATSATVPGLGLDPVTGLLSGSPTAPGFYALVIERFLGSEVVSHAFPLLVLNASGQGTIAAAQVWALDTDVTLSGNLEVLGTVDTNGKSLTVPGTFTLGGSGVFTNTAGILTYRHRSGALPSGQLRLQADAANDVADSDGDGLANLVEFYLGTDPSARSSQPLVVAVTGAALHCTYSQPSGVGGVTATLEVSGDLGDWRSGTGYTEVLSDTTGGGMRTLVVRDLGTGQHRFARLKVER